MHRCNPFCDEITHVDMSYSDDVTASEEECKRVLEREVCIEVLSVREVFEFDREVGRRAMIRSTCFAETRGEMSYDPKEADLRAFRIVFKRR